MSSEHSPNPVPQDLTQLLDAASAGDTRAAAELLPHVYGQLRALAGREMAGENPGHTLQPTALVHEAFARLALNADRKWSGRRHFFATAAVCMRRILVDHARARAGPQRGGGWHRRDVVALEETASGHAPSSVDWLVLDEALEALGAHDAELAEIVSLRFFAGQSIEQVAELLGVSSRTVNRDWLVARAWLADRLSGQSSGGAALEAAP